MGNVKAYAGGDFSVIPSLNKIKVLQLSDGEYIQQFENIALIGGIGTGKTHVAISLGLCACEQGHKVRFPACARTMSTQPLD